MSSGNIVEVIGAVVDVEFPRDAVPKIYDALKLDSMNLTLEVQAQMGDGVVRCIAMGSTDGLRRGLEIENTGAPISVPVGEGTLGRIMNVLGDEVDHKGDISCDEMHTLLESTLAQDVEGSQRGEKEAPTDLSGKGQWGFGR